MNNIRPAAISDLARISEIEIFNYRLNFYPIFKNDDYYFNELQVPVLMAEYSDSIQNLWVYDDGVVKGFTQIEGREINKLFVEPAFQGHSIGAALLDFAVGQHNANTLWALEKNTGAIRFYCRHGFCVTEEKKPVDDTTEHLVRLELPAESNSDMTACRYITLREQPELAECAAEWFHRKWGIPVEAYRECINAYVSGETEYGWYLCLTGNNIAGGLGIIENDFHNRKDLAPNVCAVYTDENHRCKGIAGRLLDLAVEDARSKGISPIYLVTDHDNFYERYGWEFLCMVQSDGEDELSKMYIHR